jgi:hypothetical protein
MNEELHAEFVNSFTELLVSYGKLSNSAEKMYINISGQALIDSSDENKKQLEKAANLPIVLEEFIPLFLKLQYIIEEKIETE